MTTVLHLLRFGIQLGAAFVTGVIYYLLAMAPAVLDGAASFVGQPIVGMALSGVATAALLILGLPVRVVPAVHAWWRRVWWLPIVLGILAVMLTVLSWLPSFQVTIHDPEQQMDIPCFHPLLGYGGWLLAIFCALHFYPPLPREKIATFLSRFARDPVQPVRDEEMTLR